MAPLRKLFVVLPLILLTTSLACGQTALGIGSKAPELEIKHWLKGKPIQRLEPNKTYVVEFWATWCAPCLESIPHLSNLQKAHPDVKFVGAGVWEPYDAKEFTSFIKKMGPKISYSIGYSGDKDSMAKTWMQAAAQYGIPTAFIVKDQRIRWIGHPLELDQPLKKILSGTFQETPYKTNFDKETAARAKSMRAAQLLEAARAIYHKGDHAKARTMIEDTMRDYEGYDGFARITYYQWMADDDPAKFQALTEEHLSSGKLNDLMIVVFFARDNARQKDRREVVIDLLGRALSADLSQDNFGRDRDYLLDVSCEAYTGLEMYREALKLSNEIIALHADKKSPDWKNVHDRDAEQKRMLEEKLGHRTEANAKSFHGF